MLAILCTMYSAPIHAPFTVQFIHYRLLCCSSSPTTQKIDSTLLLLGRTGRLGVSYKKPVQFQSLRGIWKLIFLWRNYDHTFRYFEHLNLLELRDGVVKWYEYGQHCVFMVVVFSTFILTFFSGVVFESNCRGSGYQIQICNLVTQSYRTWQVRCVRLGTQQAKEMNLPFRVTDLC